MTKEEKEKNQVSYNRFPPDSAGRLMTDKVPFAFFDSKIGDVSEALLKKTKAFESINYVYFSDKQKKLVGVLSIKDIFTQPKDMLARKVMIKELVTVRPYTDQERVAYLALKNNIKAVPVVDKDGKFLGVVPNDTILFTIYEEGREDLLRLAGIHHAVAGFDDIFKLSILQSFKHRFPWLFLGLLGGITAAQILGFFQQTLEQNLILASFIPLVLYMGSAAGTQMQAFIIRDLAINPKLKFFHYFLKQLCVVFIMALLVSFLLFLITAIFYKNIVLGSFLSVALFAAICSSVLTGLLIPFAFGKLRLDPANASGPIATIIQDILSVVVYFGIASWWL